MSKRARRHKVFILSVVICWTLGTAPVLLNLYVDPFEMFRQGTHSKKTRQAVEKLHYPLWKLTHYPQNADTIILGDSRARSLRNKYWHEAGRTAAYNFSYGGGTIPEIYSTFRHVIKNPNVKTLVVGIQLRSFDERHKGGMNRVPEAIRVGSSRMEYLKNWLVTKTAWKIIRTRHARVFDRLAQLVPSLTSPAAAEEHPEGSIRDVDELLKPEVCFGCELPTGGEETTPIVRRTKGPNLGLGRGQRHWDRFTTFNFASRKLSGKFSRQVTKNARSDWKTFTFSESYMKKIEEIIRWSEASPDRNLIFIIPPTIIEMQATINKFGLMELNEQMRLRLAKRATVLDFDFANNTTADLKSFTDAYHFSSKFARQIVRESLLALDPETPLSKKAKNRRKELACPVLPADKARRTKVGRVLMLEGRSCRVWRYRSHAS